MKTTARAFAAMSIVLLIGAGVTSCQSDTLNSGTESLVVKYVPNPSGAGRFDRSNFDVVRLQIRPSDPALLAIYGNTPLSLRFSPFTADLTQTTASTYATIALAAGTYTVKELSLTRPQLVDTDISPTPATCLDGIAAFPSGPASGAVPVSFTYTTPASLTFTVQPGQTKLNLTVNVPGLISAYENAFTCNPDCGGGVPCLIAFDADTFTAEYLANITLQ
jgi:hypothetical protein